MILDFKVGPFKSDHFDKLDSDMANRLERPEI